jgi:hypothetical protein
MTTINIINATIAGLAILAKPLGWGRSRFRVCEGPRWRRAGLLGILLLLTAGVVWVAAEEGASWPVSDATCKPSLPVIVPGGGILTLSDVPLLSLPANFQVP